MSTELATFQRGARALMRKIALYVQGGGDVLTSSKTEVAIYKSRDKLLDSMRRLGLSDDATALALAELLSEAAKAAPGLARDRRQVLRDVERAELKDKALEHRDWRIANGLQDPPRYR